MSLIANGKQDVRVAPVERDRKMATALFEPDPLEKLNWLIHLYHVRGEISKCKELIKKEIEESKGKHEYAFFKQGIILREEGKVQEALESFQVCHKLNTDNPDNIKEVAKCLFLLRRYRLSFEAYLEAEKSSSKPDWEIYHNIAQCLMCLEDVPKAKEYAKRAVQLGKQEISYSLLIKILTAEGDLQAAITVCSAALEACPDSTAMLTEAGLLQLKLGKTQEAFQNLSLALALDPSCSQALLGVGCITQAHEEYDVALTKYKVAVQINPESVALWNNIGMCFYSKQKYVAAVSCLKRALWLSPLSWRVLLNLGLVHLSTLQPASAFNFLCAAVNLRPDVGMSFMALGCALFELKDVDNSLRAFRQAVLLSKDDTAVTANTCVALIASGLFEEAQQFLEKFKALVEQDPPSDKKLLDLGVRLESALSQGAREGGTPCEGFKQGDGVDSNLTQGKGDDPASDANKRVGLAECADGSGRQNSDTDAHFSRSLDPDEV